MYFKMRNKNTFKDHKHKELFFGCLGVNGISLFFWVLETIVENFDFIGGFPGWDFVSKLLHELRKLRKIFIHNLFGVKVWKFPCFHPIIHDDSRYMKIYFYGFCSFLSSTHFFLNLYTFISFNFHGKGLAAVSKAHNNTREGKAR